MIVAARVVVLLGFAAVAALAVANGIDAAGVLIAAIVVAVGCVALAAGRKIKTGGVAPARCDACGGLVSPHAPYCKHCGASL